MASNGSQTELKEMLAEIIHNEIAPLKEEIDSLHDQINKDLKLNYLNSIARMLEKEAVDTVEAFKCAYHLETGNACKSQLQEYFSRYTSSLAMGDMANAFTILKDFDELAKENRFDKSRMAQCHQDWAIVGRIVKRHKEIAKDISASFTAREVPADIAELDFDPTHLYEDVIFPFSHPIRIRIMHALKSGSKRFTVLKNELGVKNTGLLVHHLKPLTKGGLVFQDHRKQYSLSEKGFTIARYFSQISAALRPDDPLTLTLQPLVVLQDNE